MKYSKLLLISLLLFACLSAQSYEEIESLTDTTVSKVLEEFKIPGLAVAVVKDGNVILSKGFGEKTVDSGEAVDTQTLFGIASNTKAFTCAALAMLVDDGKINWDDKVRDYIPQFKMYVPYVTEEFTIRDLVIHRSGLGLGAGDLMVWPSTDFTRDEIIHNLRYLKPVSGFRTKYDYDNLLYMVAGEIIPAATGISWENFIKERIFNPLGMNRSLVKLSDVHTQENIADPHAVIDGKLQKVDWDQTDNIAPAASIVSSVEDMSKWILMQLNRGVDPVSGDTLLSKRMHSETWKPQTLIRGGADLRDPFASHFYTYGLGWGIKDYKGKYMVSHSGALMGMYSKVTLLPEENLGIVVMTNQQSGPGFAVLTNALVDYFIGGETRNWFNYYVDRMGKASDREAKAFAKIDSVKALGNPSTLDIEDYAGLYNDPWRGLVDITFEDMKLKLVFERTKHLVGWLEHYQYNTFIARWENRGFNADVFVHFTLDLNGEIIGMKMEPISPLTDFSFDFHDLDFKPVKK